MEAQVLVVLVVINLQIQNIQVMQQVIIVHGVVVIDIHRMVQVV
jgi:hypothetical protein